MSVDTYGRIKGYVSSKEILNYIRHTYDAGAFSDVETQNRGPLALLDFPMEVYNPNDTDAICESGFICFKANGQSRSLFYFHENFNPFENLEYYRNLGLEEMVRTHTTHIGLGCFGNSDEIISDIVSHFGGGWIDENDCDDKPFHRLEGVGDDGKVPPVIYVTMKEVEEKFGGTVVITDYKR